MKIKSIGMFAIILFMCYLPVAGAVVVQQPVGSNIALGKTYTLSPAPNYSTITNDPNGTDLTDGIYTVGYFWGKATTVGWVNKIPVSITFDLGSDQPISGLSYSTAAGVAGVTWPQGLAVLVSNDKTTWYYAGDLVDLNGNPAPPALPTGSATPYRFKTTQLQAHGRYVQLMIDSIPYAFVDEVEIYEGTSDLLTKALPGPAIMDVSTWYHNNYLLLKRLRYRLTQDLNNVTQELINANLPSAISGPLNSSLQSISSQIPLTAIDSLDTFTTIFPEKDHLNVHSQIFGVQAAIWQAMGFSGVVAWPANRWDPLSPTSPPVAGSASVNVAMMNNEFRAGIFNLSNAAAIPATVTFSIQGFPGGTDPSYISVYQVPFTDTENGNPMAAALMAVPLQNGVYSVSIPPGLTQQIWLSFNPTQVPAGVYSGTIQIMVNGVSTTAIPVQLKIYPLNFPNVPTLHVGGWDYTAKSASKFYGVTDQNRQPIIQLLSKYFVDTPWATYQIMPPGSYDAKGNMTTPPDSSLFQAWLVNWPNARNYYVFLNTQTTFAGFNIGTPAWSNAVTSWLQWWVKQLKQWNVNPNQLGLLLVDEPYTAAQDNIVISYAQVIHAAEPQVVIEEDVEWQDPTQADPMLFNVSNIVSPAVSRWIASGQPTPQQFDNFYINQSNNGHQLWFYDAHGPVASNDPYAYYLAQEWLAWKNGAQGSEFWAFADSESTSSWNEYTASSPGSYSPLFIDATTVTPGKHMEALREGVEDYEYLRMLRDKIVSLQNSGVQDPALTAAQALLTSAPDTMLVDMINTATSSTWRLWNTVKDRTVADQIRGQILDALTQLNVITPYNLTVTVSGQGIVSGYYSDPGNLLINCGTNESVCSSLVNSAVTLTATAANGSVFSGWSVTGPSVQTTCTGTTSPCVVTLYADTNVTASFLSNVGIGTTTPGVGIGTTTPVSSDFVVAGNVPLSSSPLASSNSSNNSIVSSTADNQIASAAPKMVATTAVNGIRPVDIAKSEFLETGPNGGAILNGLIEKGVVEGISPTEVQLMPQIESKEGVVRQVAKDDFNKVWAILKQSPFIKAPDKSPSNLFAQNLGFIVLGIFLLLVLARMLL